MGFDDTQPSITTTGLQVNGDNDPFLNIVNYFSNLFDFAEIKYEHYLGKPIGVRFYFNNPDDLTEDMIWEFDPFDMADILHINNTSVTFYIGGDKHEFYRFDGESYVGAKIPQINVEKSFIDVIW
jgi:hypothetical protein